MPFVMKATRRLLLLLALLAGLAPIHPAEAEEPKHLDFVKGLRERGYHDLALEYLQNLQKRTQPPLPDELKVMIPLEIAKTHLEAAGTERDHAKRDEIRRQVRAQFQTFVTKNPTHVLAGQVYFDLGRLLLETGRTKAVEARYNRNATEQNALVADALRALDEAAKSFSEASKRFEERYKGFTEKEPKVAAERDAALKDYCLSLYHHGLTLYEKGTVLENKRDLAKASEAFKHAFTQFETLAGFKDRQPLGWQGLAWSGRCKLGDDANLARTIFKQVTDSKATGAEAGKRFVRYFDILSTWIPGGDKGQRAKARPLLESWLDDYREHLATTEGQQMQFFLALVYTEELQDLTPEQRKAAASQNMIEKARKLFESLENTPGDYTQVAKQAKFSVLRLSPTVTAKAVAELASFDQCLLRADIERAEGMEMLAKLDEAKDDKERQERKAKAEAKFKTMLEAAERATKLMPATVKTEDWEQVHLLLFIANFQLNETQRAVDILETLAKSNRSTTETAQRATVSALELFEQLIGQNRQAAQSEDNDMKRQEHLARMEANTKRLIEMAQWMEQKWPKSPETDAARYILGVDHAQREEYEKAAAKWEMITPKHPAYAEISYRTGLLYWSVHTTEARKNNKPITSDSPHRKKAIEMLQRAIKAGGEMAAMPPDMEKKEADPKAYTLASLTLAELQAFLGDTEQAVKLVDPLVDRIAQKKMPADLPPDTEKRILGLALRAHVQKRNVSRAIDILEALQAQGAEKELGSELKETLETLGGTLKAEIEALKQKGDAAKEDLQKTKESFREFLDHLEKKPKLPADLRLWVGANYLSVEEYDRAAKVFGSIPDPGPAGQGKDEEKQYLQGQLQRIKALRLAASAEDNVAKRTELLAKVEAELKAVTEKKKLEKHPSFVQERIALLQAQEKYSGPTGAITQWDQLRRALERHLDTPYLKEIYLEASYNLIYCMYQEARAIKDAGVRDRALQKVAQALTPLLKNEDLKPRLEEFVNQPDHRDLRDKLPKGAAN